MLVDLNRVLKLEMHDMVPGHVSYYNIGCNTSNGKQGSLVDDLLNEFNIRL